MMSVPSFRSLQVATHHMSDPLLPYLVCFPPCASIIYDMPSLPHPAESRTAGRGQRIGLLPACPQGTRGEDGAKSILNLAKSLPHRRGSFLPLAVPRLPSWFLLPANQAAYPPFFPLPQMPAHLASLQEEILLEEMLSCCRDVLSFFKCSR